MITATRYLLEAEYRKYFTEIRQFGHFPDTVSYQNVIDFLEWHDRQKKWVIVASGEGAEASVLAGSAIEQAVHNFMCCCGHDWENCESPDIVLDIRGMDDPDNWTLDERGERYSIDWPHETGKITIYKLSKVSYPELSEKGKP